MKEFTAYDFLKVKDGKEFYYCPFCRKDFAASYPSKTIISDWQHNSQLAMANFSRHLNACYKRNGNKVIGS